VIFTKSESGSRLSDGSPWSRPSAPVSEPLMVEIIQDLIHFLAKNQLTINDAIAKVGPIDHDPGAPMPMRLRSALPGVHVAELARYPDSGLPYVLTLELSPESRVTVGNLKTFLGDYKRTLTHPGMPTELIFPAVASGERWRIAVIVELEPNSTALDSAFITCVALRRDPITS
jgi:hypothetical protein